MGFNIVQDLQRQMQKAVNDITQETKKLANQTVATVLHRNQSTYTRKLRSLIDTEFYNKYAESEYYDRTYQFRKLARCIPHTEGNNCSLEIFFDIDNIVVYEPMQKGNYYSYAYTWGANAGNFIGEETVQNLYEGFLNRADILDKFMEWFEEDFQRKFETLFNQRIQYLNRK